MPKRQRIRRSRLGLALTLLGGTLLLVEILLRILPLGWFGLSALDKDWSNHRYVPHPYLAYVPRPNWEQVTGGKRFKHNSLGFRGDEFSWEKPAETYRVVCVGGSSTYGHGPSSNATTWPALLQQALGQLYPERAFEVINAGVSGYNSYESLINLNVRLLALDPDLLLVYHSINDVRLWAWPGYQPDNSHARAVWPVRPSDPLVEGLEHSQVFRAAQHLMKGSNPEELGAWVVAGYGEKQKMEQGFQLEGPYYFQRNLEHMAALCRFRDVDIAFGQQACFLADLPHLSDKKGMLMAEEVIKRTGERLGVPICDLKANMPQERALFTNDVHVTDTGSRRLAGLWAQFIRAQGFVDG